jgi:hypothetical protein
MSDMYCQMKWTILLSLFTLSNAFEPDHYTVTGGVLARSNSFVCPTGALVIPKIVHGFEITSINGGAFTGCHELASVDLSATKVTTIGAEAFMETGLTEVTFPSSLTTIGEFAFAFTRLTSVTFPAELTTIGGSAFVTCTELASVDLSATKVTTIGAEAFMETGLTSVTFPSSLTTIGEFAFGETGLTSVTSPSSLTTIGGDLPDLVDLHRRGSNRRVRFQKSKIHGSEAVRTGSANV